MYQPMLSPCNSTPIEIELPLSIVAMGLPVVRKLDQQDLSSLDTLRPSVAPSLQDATAPSHLRYLGLIV